MEKLNSKFFKLAGLLLAFAAISYQSDESERKSAVSSVGVDGEESFNIALPETRQEVEGEKTTEISTKHFIIKILSVKPKIKKVAIKELDNKDNIEVGKPLTRSENGELKDSNTSIAAKNKQASKSVDDAQASSEAKDKQASNAAKDKQASNAGKDKQASNTAKNKQASSVAKDKQASNAPKDKQASNSDDAQASSIAKDKQASNSAKDKQASNSEDDAQASSIAKNKQASNAPKDKQASNSDDAQASSIAKDKQASNSAKDKQASNSEDDAQASSIAKNKQASNAAKDKQASSVAKDKQASSAQKNKEASKSIEDAQASAVKDAKESKSSNPGTEANASDAFKYLKASTASNKQSSDSSTSDEISEEDRDTLKNAVLGEIFGKLSRGDYDGDKGSKSETNDDNMQQLRARVAKRGRLTKMFLRFLEDLAKKLDIDVVTVAEHLISKIENVNENQRTKADVRDIIPLVPIMFRPLVYLLREKLLEEMKTAHVLHS